MGEARRSFEVIPLNGKINLSKSWRIAHVLEGHTSDVRALSICDDEDFQNAAYEKFQSASRDETVKTWIRSIPTSDGGGPSIWQDSVRLHGNRYQNSVAHLSLNDQEGVTMMGGLDGRILVYKFNYFQKDDQGIIPDLDQPNQIVHEHYDNVCHLSLSSASRTSKDSNRLLISGSWDGTSRIWSICQDDKIGKKLKPLHLLKGHQLSVLDARIVSAEPEKEKYLTVSADRTIRYWHAEETIMIFNGHTDVVRSIALIPGTSPKEESTKENATGNLFATCSNDGTIKVWSLDNQDTPQEGKDNSLFTLIPKQNDGTPILDLIFSVQFAGVDAETGHRLLVSGGEGGRVYIWDLDKREEVMQILQPVSTCWDVLYLHLSGDIATADSDGKIRIYTQRRISAENGEEQKEKGMLVELNPTEMEEHDQQCRRIAQSRVRADIIATESQPLSSGHEGENIINGQRYDAILKIDVSDDEEPLSLPINKGDDPRSKAKEFIEQNNLSKNYEDDIVAFIQQVGPK